MASPSESLPETVAAPSGPMTAKLRAATPPSTVETDADGLWSRQSQLSFVIYWSVHAGCLAALFLGVGAVEITTCLGLFWLRMFGITGGYHRYFSHRTYKTGRVFQFVLALLGCMSAQKGPLWWAAGHRRHHKYSDEPGDMHSPRAGIWYSHQAWIFDDQWGETELDRIPDFARYPELVWLNRWHVVPPALLAAGLYAAGGASLLVWGFCISTTMLWHSTYSINSLAHLFGSQRYDTGDDSRNNLWLALLTLGEGWHNNHHRYMAAARNGFFWWEIDITYYTLRVLEKFGVVWSLRMPPSHLLESEARAR